MRIEKLVFIFRLALGIAKILVLKKKINVSKTRYVNFSLLGSFIFLEYVVYHLSNCAMKNSRREVIEKN